MATANPVYNPPSGRSGLAIGTTVTGGTASRLMSTDGSGNVATDDESRFDGTNFGLGGAIDSNYRVKVRAGAGQGGIDAIAAGPTDVGSIGAQSNVLRSVRLLAYGDSAAGTLGGAAAALCGLVGANDVSALLIGNPDGAPTKFIVGSNAERAGIGGTISAASTPVGNVGAGEDTLQSYTVKANTLRATNDSVWVEFTINFAANTNSKRVRVRAGATTAYDSGAEAQNGGLMVIRLRITRTGAATQIASGTVSNTANTPLFDSIPISATPGETLSGAFALSITGEAVDNDDITATARWGVDAA